MTDAGFVIKRHLQSAVPVNMQITKWRNTSLWYMQAMRTIKWRKLYIKVSLRTMWIPGNFKGTSYLAWKSCSWRYPYSKCEETPWLSTCRICDDKTAQNYHLSEHDSLARSVNIEQLQRDILLSMKRLCMKDPCRRCEQLHYHLKYQYLSMFYFYASAFIIGTSDTLKKHFFGQT